MPSKKNIENRGKLGNTGFGIVSLIMSELFLTIDRLIV